MRETACGQAKIVDTITTHRAESVQSCLLQGQLAGWVLTLPGRGYMQAFVQDQTPRDSASPCNAIVSLVLPGFNDSRHACSKGSQEALSRPAFPE